jgi:hypothetical protein
VAGVASSEFVLHDDAWQPAPTHQPARGAKLDDRQTPSAFTVAWTAASRHLLQRRYPDLTRTGAMREGGRTSADPSPSSSPQPSPAPLTLLQRRYLDLTRTGDAADSAPSFVAVPL